MGGILKHSKAHTLQLSTHQASLPSQNASKAEHGLTSRSARTFLRLLVPLKTTTMRLEPQAMSAMVSWRRSHRTSMRSRPYSLRAVSREKSSALDWPQVFLEPPLDSLPEPDLDLLPELPPELACAKVQYNSANDETALDSLCSTIHATNATFCGFLWYDEPHMV